MTISRADRERWQEILPTSEVGKALDAADALREAMEIVREAIAPAVYFNRELAGDIRIAAAGALDKYAVALARYDAAVEPKA